MNGNIPSGRPSPCRGRFMTLLGNFDSMSGQEGNDPSIWNKRSERSMRDQNQRHHQEGNVARTASHAVYAPPIDALLFLFSCPYKISQQSHKSASTGASLSGWDITLHV